MPEPSQATDHASGEESSWRKLCTVPGERQLPRCIKKSPLRSPPHHLGGNTAALLASPRFSPALAYYVWLELSNASDPPSNYKKPSLPEHCEAPQMRRWVALKCRSLRAWCCSISCLTTAGCNFQGANLSGRARPRSAPAAACPPPAEALETRFSPSGAQPPGQPRAQSPARNPAPGERKTVSVYKGLT